MTSHDQTTRRGLLKRAGGIAAAGAAVAAGAGTFAAPHVARAAGQPVKWRMQALWDANTTPMKFEQLFADRVKELTGGGFEIQTFTAGQLVPANQAFDAVRAGAFQMMKTFDGYEAGKIPAFAFTSTVPFGFPESDQYEAWFYEKGGLDMAREAYGKAGLMYIAPTVYGQEPIHSKVKISSIEEFQGKKGRFVGLASSVMGAMGVAVTPLPTAEVYSALEKGVIDIADRGDLTANLQAGLAEVAKFIILPGVHQPTTATSYVANKAAYEALPAEYKAVLAVAARETSAALRQHIVVQDVASLAKYREAGVEIVQLDPADIRANRAKAEAQWRVATKDDALATRILDSQVGFMKELGLLG
ncbi:MAG: C4-dicarboxylate ABC transporter substrate-binding protein [Tistrella sp.]|jgi:TRAP-type mannitol/chloroaromatic compound transport system substrate-binding protein|uniref:C4-dicarboxylate ABC transporter substrate-binding protein n=1 Tax=Tistrella mobilis TaxID=171437 RepID=A0A3B9IIA9_9PROT|nr:TRAP transporter substrate-binding protein DctP [Tistrella sp.]MAD36271.1 C4-dicarboxylate ABC transporter substrate-binding protein [Tistrella sp.]MBA78759.1 C4-dicarboxylate ABC transporter substrate-binding protein [Tistrella sp.]HAE47458.1 C4-dicarboxylate ABC transporter substrate-binding protein [Tistrella mobilis]|tara:strand:- start:1338 stop:2414 length:1077 start_codon:yes stop_codon:yes gene_type:complete